LNIWRQGPWALGFEGRWKAEERRHIVTVEAKGLILRMVVCAIEGKNEKLKLLYDAYTRESRLHVSIEELLEYKRGMRTRRQRREVNP